MKIMLNLRRAMIDIMSHARPSSTVSLSFTFSSSSSSSSSNLVLVVLYLVLVLVTLTTGLIVDASLIVNNTVGVLLLPVVGPRQAD